MFRRLTLLSGVIFAAAVAMPASAQIIIGGKPVTEEPPIVITPPTSGVAAPVAAPAALPSIFPVNADAPNYAPVSIATASFTGESETEADLARRITDIIRTDLASIGIFAAPSAASISGFTATTTALPQWADWSGANAKALLVGKVIVAADGRLTVQFRLFDVDARSQRIGTQYVVPAQDKWRNVAHKIADDVLVSLVGGVGGFDSRIAYASESGGSMRLGLADMDGANVEYPFDNVSMIEAPRFSPTTQTVVYSGDAPVPGKPKAVQRTTIMYDMATGRREPALSVSPQPNPDARFSPDGLSLVYSRKAGSNTDIYQTYLPTRKETRLTDDAAADTAPSLSPDGKTFAFVSERAGGANVYIAHVDGSPLACADGAEAKVCQLTKDGGYEDAVWAPVGNQIAFARRTGDRASIGIVNRDGTGQRALTTPSGKTLDIKPSWSPEGRRLVFSRIAGNSGQIHVITVKTGETRRLDVPGSTFEPNWGPKIR
jgi:TolB protein